MPRLSVQIDLVILMLYVCQCLFLLCRVAKYEFVSKYVTPGQNSGTYDASKVSVTTVNWTNVFGGEDREGEHHVESCGVSISFMQIGHLFWSGVGGHIAVWMYSSNACSFVIVLMTIAREDSGQLASYHCYHH